ncbi:MAG TPA: pyrroloquinoline quinone biosynthesis protein PqqE [Gammaproteobacteria bacterium]|nr:pyrroloquinoline quinone biosynthesis protein PqqE [Gammaproteobacteria bacterium]
MSSEPPKLLWLLAELTYSCPLQCPYCSNPLDYSQYPAELSTDEWIRVLREARALGATQLGFSGGEPLVRRDLEELVAESRALGYYSNLITSAYGLTKERLKGLKELGLDHVQVSFQASTRTLNDELAAATVFEHKKQVATWIKELGFPMVLCFVLHRRNLHQIADMLQMAVALQADYVELATTQYYGWAFQNRAQLLPSRRQLQQAEAAVTKFREEYSGPMKVYYVVPDYYESRPKACMGGWAKLSLNVTPDGVALPCHAARQLPDLSFPKVTDHSIKEIWNQSEAFNRYRGFDWMQSPCVDCPEREKDFGGCRCQAYLMTGDAQQADPVCEKSPHHEQVLKIIEQTEPMDLQEIPLTFRNSQQSKGFCKESKQSGR